MGTFLIAAGVLLILPFLNPSPQSTVILLDNNLSTSAVDVITQSGSVTIDRPYWYTTLHSSDRIPTPPRAADPDEIHKRYASLLEALPSKPVELLFYFEEGNTELTEESKRHVEELIRIVDERSPCSIDIIGHSDRAGDEDKNYALALERAEAVKNFLIGRQVTMEHLNVVSFGENSPIVPTEDGVSEPRNRVVEVFVR